MRRFFLDRRSTTPLYLQLREHFRNEIRRMTPYERFPSEMDLVRKWGVSRGTIQKALSELFDEGLITRSASKGTWVLPPETAFLRTNALSVRMEVARMGLRPKVKLLDFGESMLPEFALEPLQLHGAKELQMCWQVHRFVYAERGRIASIVSYIPTSRVHELPVELVGGGLHRFLFAYFDTPPAYSRERVTATGVPTEHAEALGLTVGAPALLRERVTYLVDDRPVMFSHLYIRTDRLPMQVEVRPHIVLRRFDEKANPAIVRHWATAKRRHESPGS